MEKFSGDFRFLQVVFTLLSRFYMPRYDVRVQILKYQVKMLRDRIDEPRIITEEEERAELMRLGALITLNTLTGSGCRITTSPDLTKARKSETRFLTLISHPRLKVKSNGKNGSAELFRTTTATPRKPVPATII